MNINDKVRLGLKKVLESMKTRGLAAMTVSFSGSNDEGLIDCYTEVKGYIEAEKGWDDLFCDLLEATGVDWYNNDGGQGTITVYADGRIEMAVGKNYVQVEDNYFKLKVEE